MLCGRNVTVKLATVTKVKMVKGKWTSVRALCALALDDNHGYTLARFESIEELGAWLEAQGFEWIAGSSGKWQSLLPQAA